MLSLPLLSNFSNSRGTLGPSSAMSSNRAPQIPELLFAWLGPCLIRWTRQCSGRDSLNRARPIAESHEVTVYIVTIVFWPRFTMIMTLQLSTHR